MSAHTLTERNLSMSLPEQLKNYDLPASPEFAAIRQWQNDDSRQVFLLEVGSDWPVFEGHFPGRPILPGIVQVHWAVQFAQVFMDKPATPAEIKQLKFRNIFQPPGALQLELVKTSEHELGFTWCSMAGESPQVHAQGRLRYDA